jgi:putative methyltransferase (TIGR04325 family)
MNYDFLNNFLSKKFTKFFPKTVNRKLLRRYGIFFVPTSLKSLPKNFYPIYTNLKDQINLVENYNSKNKLSKFNTKMDMDIFLKNLYKKKNFNYLDIGGDNIDLYLKLNNNLNIKNYYIFNFKEVINIFKKIKTQFKMKNLHPITNIKKLKNLDIVYFGSSIQYFKDYTLFLQKIFKKKPKYIFFSGTSFFKDNIQKEKLIVKQTNILPHTVYLYFFDLNKFIIFFKKNGYKLVFQQKNKFAKVNYKNFHPTLKKIVYSDILFIKKKLNKKNLVSFKD